MILSTELPLYARLLGPAWEQLPERLQRLHQTFAPVPISGQLEVRHGKTVAARLLARLLRLPSEAESVHITLMVEQRGEAQQWIRQFGPVCIATTQQYGQDAFLLERFGIVEFGFDLKLEQGQLVYHQRQVSLRLGCCALPLPKWIAPLVFATEKSKGDAVEISVEIRLGKLGLLLAYGGKLWLNQTT